MPKPPDLPDLRIEGHRTTAPQLIHVVTGLRVSRAGTSGDCRDQRPRCSLPLLCCAAMPKRYVCPACQSQNVGWNKSASNTVACVCNQCGTQFTIILSTPPATP